MCINFNYYLLFILHAFTCTVVYFILFTLQKKKKKKKKKIYIYIYISRMNGAARIYGSRVRPSHLLSIAC